MQSAWKITVYNKRIQTMEVVRMARMVPMGMERWASFRSPERLEPAMIPEEDYHKTVLRYHPDRAAVP